MNDARVVAGRNDAAEIDCIAGNDLTGFWVEACCGDGVEVADRVGKVNMIEQIEKLGAEFNVFDSLNGKRLMTAKSTLICFGPRKTLRPTLPRLLTFICFQSEKQKERIRWEPRRPACKRAEGE